MCEQEENWNKISIKNIKNGNEWSDLYLKYYMLVAIITPFILIFKEENGKETNLWLLEMGKC